MNISTDKRVVMTLDAGGTNFVFSAIQAGKEIVPPISLIANAHDLELCLNTILEGFRGVLQRLRQKPVAISFAFPGPADYPKGIIGDLPNLPAFRGGVALGPMLRETFNLPVFINNDGNLFAYGEAIAGFLPYVNRLLSESGNSKTYKNLAGFTIGTGFGSGIVHNGELISGDNSAAGGVWLLKNKLEPCMNTDEGVSIRAVRREYARLTEIPPEEAPSPKEIYEIGMGRRDGKREAAIASYNRLGEILGDAVASVTTLFDGLVVIGGGIAGAAPLFLPKMIEEMNGTYKNVKDEVYYRLSVRVFNLEDKQDKLRFLKGDMKEVSVPGSTLSVKYDSLARIAVGLSQIGTSKAISIGAYAFALKSLS